jgi:hypothetical protein
LILYLEVRTYFKDNINWEKSRGFVAASLPFISIMVDNTDALDILATLCDSFSGSSSASSLAPHGSSPSKHLAHEIAQASDNNIAPMIGGGEIHVSPSPPFSYPSAGLNSLYNDVNLYSSIVPYFQLQLLSDLQQLTYNNNLMTQQIQLRCQQNMQSQQQHYQSSNLTPILLQQQQDLIPIRNFTTSLSRNNNSSQYVPTQHASANPSMLNDFPSILQGDSCRRVTEPEQSLFQAENNLKADDCTVTSCPEISSWRMTRKEVTKAAYR